MCMLSRKNGCKRDNLQSEILGRERFLKVMGETWKYLQIRINYVLFLEKNNDKYSKIMANWCKIKMCSNGK